MQGIEIQSNGQNTELLSILCKAHMRTTKTDKTACMCKYPKHYVRYSVPGHSVHDTEVQSVLCKIKWPRAFCAKYRSPEHSVQDTDVRSTLC